ATHFGWYLYCFRLLRSMPVACKCPWGDAQIQTSRQAGGSSSERIRASICELVIGWSSLSRYTRLFPLAFRLYPFCWGDVYRSPESTRASNVVLLMSTAF